MRGVYVWEAGCWSGVSGSAEDAQRAAAGYVRDGVAGRVESARLSASLRTLTMVHERTGSVWTSRRCADGSVVWDLACRELVAAS